MANLLSNTTIGGYQSIHTGNIGSYALTSLPSHNHDDRYFTETESDGRFQPLENQRVSTSSTVRFSNTYTTAWFRNDNSNTGLYNESTTMHWSSNENGYWDISSTNNESSIRFYTGGHKSALRGHVYADTSNNIGFLNNAGSWSLRTTTSRNTILYGNLTVGQDAANSSIFMSDSDEGMREIHCNSNRIGFLTQAGSWGAYADDSANWFATGYIQSFASMYSPTYYDGNNSSYYMDLDGISNIWRLQVNGKYTYFGSSDNWDNGNLNGTNSVITNVHFQGHVDFWIGAGNTKWYTGAVGGHHDLLINTMQSGGSNTRGITFTASSNGVSVYRLGRWFAHSDQAGSYLQVDGSIRIGATSDTYSTPSAKLQVVGSTAGTDVLAVDGVYGRLFTVTDDLSDSLFSVNTIAGLPVIEAFADNTVKIGKYGSNSITISGSKIAINSDTVDANFPFFVGDRSVAGARYSMTNKGMGFNLADNYAQLQLYGGSGAYIDFTTASGQDSAGRIMWNGNFVINGDTYFNNTLYTYTLYDRNDTGYYLDMNGTSRLGTLNINQLSVYGNTYLGDGNGDEVHINDILRVGATDSGDAHFYFGEGGSAGSDYGSHWYWDSGYTFTWNTRNAGTDTAMFDYVTNDTTYINWRRNFHMQNREINYTAQLHFNGGTRFVTYNSNYLYFQPDSTSVGGILVRDGNSSIRGYSAYFDGSGFGLLNSTGNWGIRLNPGNVGTELYHAGNLRLDTRSGGIGVQGNVYTNANYGYGLVGLYSSVRYQGVFAMSDDYKLLADGTGTGNLYGIAWTHTNVGGQSKTGLDHQALFVTNGITQTAIGTGIWTSGLITTTSYGTSANWNTAFGWGNHASVGYLTSLPSHNHDDRYYTEAEINSQIGDRLYQARVNGLDVNAFNDTGLYRGSTSGWSNRPTFGNNAGALLHIDTHPSNYAAQLFFDTGADRLYLRNANGTSWGAWNVILHSGNYTSYSPSLTGGGASGTWSINVTGSAGSASSATTAINLNGLGSIQSTSTGTSYTANYQVRENSGGGGNTNEIYAPQLAFHWGGVVASSIMLESSGRMAIRNNPGGSYENFIAAVIYSSGYGDSTQWNTAYSWGNHASAGYQSASTAINTGNIGSQSVSYAATAGSAPANGGNSSTVGGFGAGSFFRDLGFEGGGANANTIAETRSAFTYSSGSPWTGPLAYFGASGYGLQLNATYQSGVNISYRTRNGDNATWNSWREFIHSGNIGSQSVSYASTAGSAPANGGNSSTVGGYSVSVGASANTIPTRNSSGYLIPESWIQLNGTYGLYSPTNNAHLRPNSGSYGSWQMTGSRNGWQGIEFDSGSAGNISLMVAADSNTVGFHNNNYGWQFRWNGGTLYVYKNAYGAGTEATVLDSSNYSSWAQPIASAINTGNIGSQSVSYATSAQVLSSTNYIIQRGSNGSWNADFQATPAGSLSYGGDLGANGTNGPGGSWWIQQNFRHTNASNYWGTQVAWGWEDNANRLATRNITGGSYGAWVYYLNSSNFTSYAPSLTGSGASGTWSINVTGSAGSAGSATSASQLTKYGDIYGDNWNTYYVGGKLIVSAALGMSGANKPPTSYEYGVALSYGESGGPLMQMYFPENSGNGTTIFKKGTYRTGWNGNWSTWKTFVEQEGNLCTIVGGNGTGLEVHGNVGYNQDPLTYFLLRGQADTSWKALKIRLTGDAGGQDIEFRRIAENTTDSRMFYIPRGANTVNFDYPIVQPSDSRLKDNITPISTPVDKIKSLRGVEFDWNSGEQVGTHDVGLIAQDVEAVLPEAVTTQEDGYKNLAYTKVIPLLVEAMKEQQALIEALRAEVELLKNK